MKKAQKCTKMRPKWKMSIVQHFLIFQCSTVSYSFGTICERFGGMIIIIMFSDKITSEPLFNVFF